MRYPRVEAGRGSLNVVLIILEVITNICDHRLLEYSDAYRSRVFSKQS